MIIGIKGKYIMKERFKGDCRKNTLSPVFNALADYYISPNAYDRWSLKGGEPLEFKEKVKAHLVSYINQSVEPYVKGLPFLKIDLSENIEKGKESVLFFDKYLQEFLNDRKIVKVRVHNTDAGNYIVPLTAEEIRKKNNTESSGGYEINLKYEPIQQMLTSLSHEIAHTYFDNISSNPPKCLISNKILERREWYRESEGLAFDFGREILLPRRRFEEYVTVNYKTPSLKNFLKMHSELKVSKDVLSQRLLRDLKLWKACIFWGKAKYNLDKQSGDPHIFVRDRDKRKNDFKNLSLTKELKDPNSDLRRAVLKHIDEDIIENYCISLGNKSYSFDMKTKRLTKDEKYFTAIFY